MPRHLKRRLLLSFALFLGLARLATAEEIPLIDDPEAQVRHYVDALARQDFDSVAKIGCGADNPTDCEFGKSLRNALAPLKGRKLTEIGKVLDLSFPEAIREIYLSMRVDDYTPVYLRFTYRMSDAGWRHRDFRFATGSASAIFPASLLEGSLVGLTGANRTGPATAVDETSEKIMTSIARRNYDGATNAVRQVIPNSDEGMKRSVDGLFANVKQYDFSHIRKIIDREMDGIRQQFYYAAISDRKTMFIRLTYAKANARWWLHDIQFSGEGNGLIPADILKDSLALLPLP
ncbi:hypothetical protein AB4037_16565 [Labrys sp. KB_33_2]|uniref:hypothetical protein n=1 Tax=Labrys sp. KB_33_2 TaxID=3237479 RepID=UPI003F9251BF